MSELPLILNIFVLFLLLFGSAFFCFAEGSIFSLSRHQTESLRKEGKKSFDIIESLRKDPFKLIITILFADEVVNVAYSSVVGLTVQKLFFGYSEKTLTILSIAIASPTLLLLGEIGPKTIAVKFPKFASSLVAYPLNLFHVFITPIRWVLMILSIGFTKLLGGDVEYEQHKGFTKDELRILVGMGSEEGVLNEFEGVLVGKFFNLEKIPVYKIMTPIVDCFFLPSTTKINEAVYEVKKRGYSRTPVFQENRDNIIGILYSKDLLISSINESALDESIVNILRAPYFIPRTKVAFELLREFQKKRNHIAIVVDEYGRVDGLVTLEDILEEMFGEIEDERRVIKKDEFRWEDNVLILPGSTKIDEFNDNFLFTVLRFGGLERLGEMIEKSVLPSEEQSETLGGLIFDLFGRFPNEGESVYFGGIKFTVHKIVSKRISEIRAEISDQEVAKDVA